MSLAGYHTPMPRPDGKLLIVLGPTASGKTALACRLASLFDGEILSADSRQVYRGLDIGSGKDLEEYRIGERTIPHHLIDIASLDEEYNVFRFQRDFLDALKGIREGNRLPILAGGTGLYLEAALSDTLMQEAPENFGLRDELAKLSVEDLENRLAAIRPGLHNRTDLGNRTRTIRAIEIAEHARVNPPESAPRFATLILGTRWPRAELHARIETRLRERIAAGLVEEVEGLLNAPTPPERLRALGLEYRYVTDYLDGRIRNENDLFQKLASAIKNFAKRQQTWFRRMERRGSAIHWIDRADPETAAPIAEALLGADEDSP